jgi:hypothetical protein
MMVEIKNNIPWKSWIFWLLLISVALFLISFLFNFPKTLQIILAYSYLCLHIVYFIRFTYKSENSLYPKPFYIFYFVIAFFIFGGMTAVYVNEVVFAASFLLSAIFSLLIIFCVMSTIVLVIAKNSKGNKRIFLIILAYVSLVLSIILLFMFLYIFSTAFPPNSLQTSNQNLSINPSSDYLYFSSTTFYSASYGEIYPVGNIMRFLTQLEVSISFILHVIVIAWILSKPENSDS